MKQLDRICFLNNLQELPRHAQQTTCGGSAITWGAGWLLGAAVAGFLNVTDDMRQLLKDAAGDKPFPPR